jgi:hypothetical protein
LKCFIGERRVVVQAEEVDVEVAAGDCGAILDDYVSY